MNSRLSRSGADLVVEAAFEGSILIFHKPQQLGEYFLSSSTSFNAFSNAVSSMSAYLLDHGNLFIVTAWCPKSDAKRNKNLY